jgi:hypothetical protein
MFTVVMPLTVALCTTTNRVRSPSNQSRDGETEKEHLRGGEKIIIHDKYGDDTNI